MEILDKYKDIITRIEEMCTSTAVMAPYPVGATGITTYKYGKSRSKGSKEGKMPTPRKAIVEELMKQCKGNQRDNLLLGYKYQKTRGSKKMDISETIKEIATLCEAIIGEGNFEEAKQKFDTAKQEKQRAWDILAPRIDQISKYVKAGKKVPKLLDARYQRKYNNYKQAEQAEEQARKDFENS